MFTIGAFAIIFDGLGRVLLCHRRDIDVWNLPGGGLESRELPTDAVIREVREETGLQVTIKRLVGIYGKTDKDELVFSFTCNIVAGRIMPTDEASECRYFEVGRIPANTSPKQVERIHDALEAKSQPIIRLQTGPTTQEMLKDLHARNLSGQ